MPAQVPTDELSTSYKDSHHKVYLFPTGWTDADTWTTDTRSFSRIATETDAAGVVATRAEITNATTVTLSGTPVTATRVHVWKKSKL